MRNVSNRIYHGIVLGLMSTLLCPVVNADPPQAPPAKGASVRVRAVGRIDRLVGKGITATLLGQERRAGLRYRPFHPDDTFQVPVGSRLMIVVYGTFHRYELTGGTFTVGDNGMVRLKSAAKPLPKGTVCLADRGALDTRLVTPLPPVQEEGLDPEYAAHVSRTLASLECTTPIGSVLSPAKENEGIPVTFAAPPGADITLRVFHRKDGNAEGEPLLSVALPPGNGSYRLPFRFAPDAGVEPALLPGEEYDWLLSQKNTDGRLIRWSRATFRVLPRADSDRIREKVAGIIQAAGKDVGLRDISLLRLYLAYDLQGNAWQVLNRMIAASKQENGTTDETLAVIAHELARRYAPQNREMGK